jgi:signal transduction histidine kinase
VWGIDLNSKHSSFYLNSTIIVIALTSTILLLENYLSQIITSTPLRVIVIFLSAFGLYFFLSSSLIEHYKIQEKNLKNLVDETLHELNTPIATINANLKMLKDTTKDEKNLKRLSRIEGASLNLTKLYQSINHSIKDEIQENQKEIFDLKKVIEKSLDDSKELLQNLTVDIKIPKSMINADKNGFIKMIDNLLANAIKYNKKQGFIKIYLKNSTLYIEDSGVGIDTKNLFIVFEKSYQENPTTKGYGLGLSIVKSYCDKEKISIKIETKKDIGTTIMLDLTKVLYNES